MTPETIEEIEKELADLDLPWKTYAQTLPELAYLDDTPSGKFIIKAPQRMREVNERIAKEIMGWDFSSILFDQDLNGCYLMEEIIKKKGLASNYFHKLSQLISGPNTDGSIPSSMDAFDWIHATAAQRVEAAIQMLDELGGE